MPFLELPKRFHTDFAIPNQQPRVPVTIDQDSTYAKDLEFYWDLSGGQVIRELVTSNNFSPDPTKSGVALHRGVKSTTFLAGNRDAAFTGKETVVGDNFTITTRCYYTGSTTTATEATMVGSFIATGGFATTSSSVYPSYVENGQWFTASVTWNQASGLTSFYLDGEPLGTGTINRADSDGGLIFRLDPSTNRFDLFVSETASNLEQYQIGGSGHAASDSWVGGIDTVAIHQRVLTAAEIQRLHRDIYQVLKPANDPHYFFSVGVPGGVTIDVPTGALTLTGQAPVIDATDDKAVEIPLGALDLTGLVPTIQAGAAVDVEIPTGALNLTGFAPVIQTGDNVTVDIPTGALSLTGFIPTVVAPTSVSVPLGALLLSGFAPTVIAGIGVEIPLGALNLSGFAPNIDLTDNLTVSIPLGALTLTGFAPVADIGDLAVSIPLGSLNLTGFIPTILAQGIIWTVQPDTATNWTEQTDNVTTWTIQ